MKYALFASLMLVVFFFRTEAQPIGGGHRPGITGPHVIIYKTKGNYAALVPVTLSADKKTVVTYPDPKDVFYKGALAYPWLLSKDYLLDNRGVNQNSAFIKLTYAKYSKLYAVPPVTDLLGMVVDNDPFTEMYDLGPRANFKNIVKEVNDIIDKGELGKYTKVK